MGEASNFVCHSTRRQPLLQFIKYTVCLGTYAGINPTIYMFLAEWATHTHTRATLGTLARNVGDQTNHGISYPAWISKINSGNCILWAINQGVMLSIYSGSQKYVPTFERTLHQIFQLWLC